MREKVSPCPDTLRFSGPSGGNPPFLGGYMKRSRILHLVRLAIILVMAYSGLARSTTYYVSQDGADRNSGLGWAEAWRTLEHAGQTARAGDLVIVRRGSEPYRYLPVGHSGSQAEPIVFRGE